MTQAHMDRLTSIDVSFLEQESPVSHMHIGGIALFAGPPPSYDDFIAHIRSRLHLVPRYRQKLAFPPAASGRPFWIDDPSFNLDYHVRHSALPSPGSEDQLRNLIGRVFSQQLDRGKPLWELWLIQGLEGDRFALISKHHHALVDGISGVDIASVLFDSEPDPETHPPAERWTPSPEPSGVDLIARGVRDLTDTPLRIARRAQRTVLEPRTTLGSASEAAEGIGELALALANPAPEVPLNAPIGSHRRFEWVHGELGELREIKSALGGTVNDVVLCVVAGALREWLHSRGVKTAGLELRALVPVSIRTGDERGRLGNRIAAMRGPLPVYVEDPVERLQIVSEAMRDLKSSKQALGAEVISRFNDFAPPTLLSQASRLNFSTRLFNLIVTNVPGPQVPLYVLGHELEAVYPVAFLPRDHALAIAIMSYNGGMNFGLLGDFDVMDDLETIAAGIDRAVAELLEIARASGNSNRNGDQK